MRFGSALLAAALLLATPAFVSGQATLPEEFVAEQAKIGEEIEALKLEDAEVYLYNLAPEGIAGAGQEDFHGFPVLAKAKVPLEDARQLRSALASSARDSIGMMVEGSTFRPREALRIKTKTRTVDFIIWFEGYRVWARGQTRAEFLISSTGAFTFRKIREKLKLPKLEPLEAVE
ncbi:MAG: hypothetical protein JSR82_19895 [Verrucomicrobia bacterium]|nr:hypothetical protein [Verrucomicrobiota bacterium]